MECLTYVDSELKEALKKGFVSQLTTRITKSDAKPFSIDEYVKEIYNRLLAKSDIYKKPVDIVRIIPTLLTQAMTFNSEFSKLITNNNPQAEVEMAVLKNKFEKSLDNVRDHLGLNESFGLKLQSLQNSVDDLNQKEVKLDAITEIPNDVFATYGDERVGKERNLNIQRAINKELSEQITKNGISDSSEMTYPSVTGGIYGSIVTAKAAKEKHKESFIGENTTFYNYSNTKLLLMIITDNTGNPIKFNDDGVVDPNGKIAYFKINDIPPGLDTGNKIITDEKEFGEYLKNIEPTAKKAYTSIFKNTNNLINSITDYYKKFLTDDNVELAKEKAIELVTKQFGDIKRMSEDLYNSQKSGVNTYSVVLNGSKGFIEHNIWKTTPLSDISFKGPIQFEIPQKENVSSMYKQGNLLFSYPGINKQIAVGRSFSERMNIVNNILIPLFTKQVYTESAGQTIPLSIAERSRFIEQYLYTNDIKFIPVTANADTWVDTKGRYTINVHGDIFKIDFENTPESIETRKKLSEKIKMALLQPMVKSKIDDAGRLVPEHKYSEEDINKAINQGAHIITNLKDAIPGSIYKTETLDENKQPIPNKFNYYQVFFPVINSKAGVVLNNKIEIVSINNIDGKNILTTKDQSFSDFAKENFVTSSVPDNNGVLHEKSPKISFKPLLNTVIKLKSKPKKESSSDIHDFFKGKIVFATSGSGKSEFAQINSDVVDGDVLVVNAIKQIYGNKFKSNHIDSREIIKDFWDSSLPIGPVYELAKKEAQKLAHVEGKTVLTGSLHVAPVADIALHQINSAHIRQGYEKMSKERKIIADLNNVNKYQKKSEIPVFDISKKIEDVITKSPEKIKNDTVSFLNSKVTEKTNEEKLNETIKPLTQKLTASERLAETIAKLKKEADKNKLQKSAESKLENTRSTDEQIADGEKWYTQTAKELSKHFPYKIMFNAVNTGYGPAAEWATHGVTLYHYYNAEGKIDKLRSGDFTDLYHEAWHGFSQTFLTHEERTALYSEVANKQGSFRDYKGNYVMFKDASPLQLEEFLAEDFRNYMLVGGKAEKGAPVKNGIFRRIMNFLKALFIGVTTDDVLKNPKGYDKVHQIYEKLKIGDLSTYNFDVNNMDKTIGSLYQSLKAVNSKNNIQELDIEEATMLVNSMNSLISDLITKVGPDHLKTKAGKEIVYDYVKNSFSDSKEQLQKDLDKTENIDEKNTLQQSINTLQWAIDEFGDIKNKEKGLIAYYIEKTKFLSEEEKEDFFGENDIDEDYQTTSGTDSDFARLGNTMSQMQHGGELMNQLMRGIHKYDNDRQLVLNKFGISELADYHQVWNKLGRMSEGLLHKTQLNDMLKEHSGDPMIAEVLAKLGELKSDMSDSTDRLWSKFWSTFNLAKIKLEQMTVHEEGNTFTTHIGSAHTQSSKVTAIWRNGFGNRPLLENGFIKLNNDEEYNVMMKYLDVPHIIKSFTIPGEKGKFNGNKIEFFKAMGINFSTELGDVKKEIKHAIDIRDVGSATVIFNKLRRLYNERDIKRLYSLNEIFKEYSSNPEEGFELIASNEGDFSALAELETRYSDYAPNDMVTTAKGTTQFEKSLNNTISVIVATLNHVDSYAELMGLDYSFMKYLDVDINPFAKSSKILNSIFDLSNYKKGDKNLIGSKRKQLTEESSSKVKVNMTNLSGIVMLDEKGGVGESLAQVDEFAKLIADIHLNTEGLHPELMRHADKGTSFSFWVTKVIAEDLKSRQYIANEDFIESTIQNLNSIPAYRKMHKIMFNYLDAELQRMDKLKELSKRIKAGEKIQYDAAYLKKGQSFVIFKGILDPETQLKLKNLKNIGDILKRKELVNDIESQLNKYFEWNTDRVSKKLDKAKYIDKAVISKIRSTLKTKGITDKTVTNNIIEKGIVRSFVVNNWIHNLETMIMIYGDLALYKDFHKRNAGAGSTGNLVATDKVSIQRVNNHGRLYERSLKLIDPETGELKVEKLLNQNGSVDSAIFTDNNPASIYYDIILKNYEEDNYKKLKAITPEERAKVKSKVEAKAKEEASKYEKIEEEGNAQGWSTFDFYRILSNLIGKWGPEQQIMYNDLISGKEVDVRKVTDTFPVLKLQYWGQLEVGDMLPLTGFHKFSVLPLIPKIIAKEGTNLYNLHLKMMQQDIDYSLFKSGSKISTITNLDEDGKALPDQFYKGDDNNHYFNKTSKLVKNKTFLQFMKDQLDIAPYYKEKVTFPTQMRKLIEIGLMANEVPTDYVGGKELWNSLDEDQKLNQSENYKKLKIYEGHLTAYSQKLKAKFEKEGDIKYKNGKVKITPKLLEFLTKQLDTQDLGDHEIAFIKESKKGGLTHDLSISLTAEKFEKSFNSLIVRKLVKQKFLGEGLVQVAGTGWENETKPTSLYEKLHHGTNGLEFYRPERTDDIIDSDKTLNTFNVKYIDRIIKTAEDNTVIVVNTSVFESIYLWDKSERTKTFDEKKLRSRYIDKDSKFKTNNTFELITDNGIIHIVKTDNIKSAENIGEKFKTKNIPLLISSSLDASIQTSQIILSNNKNRLVEVKKGNTRAMKVKIALQGDYVKLLDAIHNDGEVINTLERLNEMLRSERWLNVNNHRKMVSLIGPRIPVQGLNSQEFAEVLEFLDPRTSNIIILPSEIVVKAGGDYDIDKLTMMFPHISSGIKWNNWETEKGIEKLKKLTDENPDLEFDLSSENVKRVIEERKQENKTEDDKELLAFLADNSEKDIKYINDNSEEGLQNNILDSMFTILSGKDNYSDLTRPNDTNILKPIAEILAEHVMEYNPKEGLYNNGEFEDTRVLEVLHNLYVHTSNNIGKQVLGIAAKVNTYHALLTRIGAYLNHDYTTGNGQNRITKDIRLLVDHNFTTNNKREKVISLAGIYDADSINKISDVISQIMNGAVDVAKDAWLFNIQGNKEAMPVLLFMILSGVPAKQAIYLASNPLVREYVNQQRLAKSIFAKLLGNAPENPKFYRQHARKKILHESKYGINCDLTAIPDTTNTYIKNAAIKDKTTYFTSPDVTNLFTGNSEQKEKALLKAVTGFKERSKTLVIKKEEAIKERDTLYKIKGVKTKEQSDRINELTNIISTNIYSDNDRAAFLHFIEIEDMSKAITALTSTTDVDTARTKSTFEAEAKLEAMEILRENPIFPEWVVTKIIGKPNKDSSKSISGESPIASFNIQNFQVKFLEPLFKLINNASFNKFILGIRRTNSFDKDVKKAGGDEEKYINKLRYSLVSFIFQNYLRKHISSLNDITSYNGVDIKTKYDVVKVSSLNQGVFVQKNEDGKKIIYLNKQELEKSFKELKSNPERKKVGINLNKSMFEDNSSYYNFIFEKEILRSQFQGVEGWERLQKRSDVQARLNDFKIQIPKPENMSEQDYNDKINILVYENTLKSMALDNTFNMYKMFKSNESMADELTKIQMSYPELVKNYSILNNIVADTYISKNERINNIILTDPMLDGDNINLFHQNLRDLSSSEKIKLVATTEEKERITDFFRRMTIYSFIQAGLNTKGKFSLIRLMPQDQFTKLMTIYGPNFLGKINRVTLDNYYKKFKEINKSGRTKNRYANWAITDFDMNVDLRKAANIEETVQNPFMILETDNKNNSIYVTSVTKISEEGVQKIKPMDVNQATGLLSSYSEHVFVTNGLIDNASSSLRTYDEALNRASEQSGFGNVISIPVKDKKDDGLKDESDVIKNIQGIDISSNTKGLGGALTNPTSLAKNKGKITREYPVEFKGKIYKDAETAYQMLKETATKDEGPNSTYNLMVQIIKAKLEQHPVLTEKITEQGGTQFILKSIHQPTTKNTVWETGGKNWFIKALNEAYLSIAPVEEPNTLGIQPLVKAQIDNAIEALKAQNFEKGRVVFPKTGIGQSMIGADVNGVLQKNKPMLGIKTFTYLSQKLFDEFQYLNPNFEYALSKQDLENYVQKNQPVSDVDVNKARNINKPEGLPGIGRTSKTCE